LSDVFVSDVLIGTCLGQSSGHVTRQHRHCWEPLQVLSYAWHGRSSDSAAEVERADWSWGVFSSFHSFDIRVVEEYYLCNV